MVTNFGKKNKVRKGLVAALLTIIVACACALGGLFGTSVAPKGEVASADAVGTKIDLGTGGLKNNTTATAGLKTLFGVIATGKTDYAGVDGALTKTNGTILQTAKTSHYVSMGGYNWDIVAVSRNSDGDVCVTLWLAASSETYKFNDHATSGSQSNNYPSSMYGTSKIRSYLVGSTWAASATASSLSASVQSTSWKTFITNYGDQISTPSTMAYQGTESAKTTLSFSYNLPNDAHGNPGGFYSGFDFSSKTNYKAWSGDKIWLPSLTETGYNGESHGLWKTTTSIRKNASSSSYQWSRSGYYSSANCAYILYADGTNYNNYNTTNAYVVRPALHLNLKSAASAAGVTKVDAPAGNYATGTTSFTYTGSAQTIVKNFNTSYMTATRAFKKIDGTYGSATDCTESTATNAGTYKYTFTLNDNCQWNDETGGTGTRTLEVTIAKADLTISAFSYGTVTYGTVSGTPSTLTVKRGSSTGTTITTGYGDVSYEVSASSNSAANTSYPGKATVASDGKITPNQAGKVQIKVKIAANDNYKAAEKTCDVTIGRKAVAIPAANYATGKTSFTFTGAAQTLVKNWNKDQMTATYQYAPYATGTGIDGGTAVAADTAIAAATAALNYTHAGVYTFKITPNGNHQWDSGTGTALTETKTVTVTVSKAAITVTYSSYSDKSYTGNAQGPSVAVSIPSTVTANKPSTTVTDTNSYTQTDFTKTVVGDYTATFALKDKYKNNFYFVNGQTSGANTCTAINGAATGSAAVSATRSYKITNATITVGVAVNSGLTAITASGTSFTWTYNNTTYSLSGVTGTTAASGNVLTATATTQGSQTATWKFKAGTTAPSTSESSTSYSFKDVADAKTISYRVSAPNHADATGTITITINKASIPAANVSVTAYNAKYDGASHNGISSVSVTMPDGSTGTWSYSSTQTGTYGGSIPTVKNYTAGTDVWYKITNPNYNDYVAKVTAVVSKRVVTVTAADKSSTYGNAIATLTATVTGDTILSGEATSVYSLSTTATSTSNVNTYTITVTDKGNTNYTVTTVNGTYTIEQRGLTVTLSASDVTYDGKAHGVTLTFSNVASHDTGTMTNANLLALVTYSYADGAESSRIHAGGYTATFALSTGTPYSNYSLAAASVDTVSFTISPKDITGATVSYTDPGNIYYTGSAQAKTPSVSIILGTATSATALTVTTDFTVIYTNSVAGANDCTGAGDVTMTVSGTGNYTGTASATAKYTIHKAQITAVEWDSTAAGANLEYKYDATAHTPKITKVTSNSNATLPTNLDDMFTYTYTGEGDEIARGTYTGTATIDSAFTANFEFSNGLAASGNKAATSRTYKIVGEKIVLVNDAIAAAVAYSGTYNGKKNAAITTQNLTTTIAADAATLQWWYSLTNDGADWTLTMPEFEDAGTYTVYYKVTANNHEDYTGSVVVSITSKNIATNGTISVDTANVDYTGSAITTPKPVIKNTHEGSNEVALVEGTDYTITGYANNVNAGTATINVSGKGNYTGTWSVNFTIDKVALVNVTVDVYGGASGATYDGDNHNVLLDKTGDVITGAQASDKTSIKWYYATSDLAVDAATGWSQTMPTVRNVSDSKTIWYKVEANNHITSTGSFTVTINAKDIATDAKLNGGNALADRTYTGTEIKPADFTVENELVSGTYTALVKGTDYDLNYADNTVVGTATITVTGKGNYTGTTDITFKIVAANGITASASAYGGASGATYDADEHNALASQNVTVTGGNAGNNNNNATWHYSLVDLNNDADDAGWSLDMPKLRNATPTTGTTVYWMVTADNCNPVFGSVKVIIKKARITAISGITADGKAYDGTNATVDADGNSLLHYDSVTFTGIQGTDILYISGITGATFGGSNRGTYNVTIPRANAVTIKSQGADGNDNDDYLNYELNLSANIVISGVQITARVVEISWSDLEIQWDDGKELKPTAEISNLIDGDSVSVIFKVTQGGKDIVSSAPGKYTATVTGLEGDTYGNYTITGASSKSLSAIFEITTAGTVVRWDVGGLVYDGSAKLPKIYWEEITEDNQTVQHVITDSALESGSKMVIRDSSGNEIDDAINAGTYTVTLTLNVNHVWADDLNGGNRAKTISFTVEKALIEGVKLMDGENEVHHGDVLSKTYNESAYTLSLDWSGVTVGGKSGMPAGVSAVILYNGAASAGVTNAGDHVVTVKFTVDGNFYAIDDITADLIIAKRAYNIEDTAYGVTFDGKTVNYSGSAYTLAVDGTLPKGVSVLYSYSKGGVNYGTAGVKGVGVYTVTARFVLADGDNNKLVNSTGAEVTTLTATLTINKRNADVDDVTFTDKTDAVYSGEKQQIFVTGAENAEGITGITYEYRLSGSTELLSTDGVVDCGTYVVTAVFAVDGTNYDDSQTVTKTATLKILPKALTVDVADAEITYGDNPANAAFNVSFKGLAASDTESSLGTLVYSVDGSVYVRYGDAGVYANAIKVSGLNSSIADNYTITYNYGTLTVKAKEITVRWQKGQSDGTAALVYDYNGAQQAPYAVATNTVHGDVVTLVVDGAKTDAGLNYTATVTAVMQNGAVSKNYVLPANGISTSFDILPKPKNGVIIWDNDILYYNGEEQAPKAYYYENENDNMPKQLTVNTDRRAVNEGTYTATVSLGGNYTLTGEQTKTFKIEKRKVYIVIGDLTVGYGLAPDMSAVSWTYYTSDKANQFVDGEDFTLTFTTSAVAGSAIGTYAITGGFTSNNAGNYEVKFTNEGTLTITEGAYDMSDVTFLGTTVTYNGDVQKISVNGLPQGVTAMFNYTRGGWSYGTDGVKDAGVYTVIVSFKGNDNYGAIADKTVTFTVNKAALTITANDVNITYGEEPTTDGVTYSIEGVESELLGTLTLDVEYVRYGDAGKYKITPAGLGSDNYEITYKEGTLTVAPRALGVTWYDDENKSSVGLGVKKNEFVYDFEEGVIRQPYAVAEGAVNGDEVTLTVEGGTAAVGLNYTATITAVSSGNYYVPDELLTAVFSVTNIGEVIWDNTALYYNGEEQKPKAYFFADGETTPTELEVTVSGAHKNAGVEYTATLTGKLADGITDAPELDGEKTYKYEILKKQVSVTIGNGSLTYGEVEANLTALLGTITLDYDSDAFVTADGVSVKLECKVNDKSNVGTYEITGTCTNDNYEITFVSGELTVTKATVNVSGLMTDATKPFSGLAQTIEVSTLPAGIDKVTYTYYKGSVSEANKITAAEVLGGGTYIIVATFTPDNNHEVSGTCQATLVITKADLTSSVKVESLTVTYDGKTHKLLLSGDTAGVEEVTFKYNGIECDGVKNVDTYTVEVILKGDENHNDLTLTGATLKIEQAKLTVRADNVSITYGDNPATITYSAKFFGLVSTDSESDLGTLTFGLNGYAQYGAVGTYTDAITVSGLSGSVADNYEITYEAGTLTVAPKEITSVEWYKDSTMSSDPLEYIYDADSQTAYIPYAVANGTVNGDEVVLKVEVAKINVGDDYVARVTGVFNTDGTKNGNYTLPVKAFETNFKIKYANPEDHAYEIVWNFDALYYNGTAQKPTASYYDPATGKFENIDPANVVTGDKSGFELSSGAVNAGEYTAWVKDSENKYTNSQVKVKFSVSARIVYVVIGDLSVSYGETPNMSAVSWNYLDAADEDHKFVSGEAYEFTFTTTAVAGSAVGTYAISGSVTLANADNYEVVFTGSWASAGADNGKCGTLTVNKATYDMSKVTFAGTEVVYNGYKQKITVNGLPEGVEATCVYTSGNFGGNNDGVKNAGTYTVTISFKGNENYYAIEDRTATLKIKKAALEVRASDNTIIYGEEPEANGVTYAGFVGDDNETAANVLQGAVEFKFDYIKNGDVGNYGITPFGLTSENYEITFRAGTLTVAPRTVTVSWFDDYTVAAQTYVYVYKSGTKYQPYAVLGNLVEGDTVTHTVTDNQPAGATSQVGSNYTATVSALGNKNYTLPTDGSESVEFTVRPVSSTAIVWDNTPLYYNGKGQAPRAYLINEDGTEKTLNLTKASYGMYANRTYVAEIDPDNNADVDLGNLTGSQAKAFTILPLPVTVKVGNASATYGNVEDIDKWTFAGAEWSYAGENEFVGSDGEKVVLSSLADNNSVIGTYAIIGSIDSDNYEVTFIDGTLTVEKATVTVSDELIASGNIEKTYNGLAQTAEIAKLPEGIEKVTYTYYKGSVSEANLVSEAVDVGTYVVVVTFTPDNNHVVAGSCHATLVIKAADINSSVKLEGDTVTYDGKTHKLYVSGDMTGIESVEYEYYSATGTLIGADGVKNAGTYTVKAILKADKNHKDLTLPQAELVIEKKHVTVKADNASLVYGEDPAAATFGVTVAGLANGEVAADVLNISYSCDYVQYGAAGSYVITVTATDKNGNYVVDGCENGTLTVTPKVISSVEWFDEKGGNNVTGGKIVYVYKDGKLYLPYAQVATSDLVNGQQITLVVELEKMAAGNNYLAKVVKILDADGNEDKNYAVPVKGFEITFTIEDTAPETGDIVWDYTTVYYDGKAHKPSANRFDGAAWQPVDTELVKVYTDGTELANGATAAGTYTAKVEGTDAEMTFVIERRKVYVVVGDLTVRYGETPNMGAVSWQYLDAADENHKFVSGETFAFTFTTTAAKGSAVGAYAISGSFTSANADNYEVVFTGGSFTTVENNGSCGTLTIIKAVYDTSKVTFGATEVVYNGEYQTLEVIGLPEGVEVTCVYTLGGFEYGAIGVKDAGTYSVTVSFTGDDNHEVIADRTVKFVITKAALTVTANESKVVYGDEPKANGVSYEGFKGTDDETVEGVLGGSLDYKINYVKGGNAGNYTITPEGLTARNYEITYKTGALIVAKRTITISWYKDERKNSTALKYTYDGITAYVPYAEAGNVVAGDTVKLDVSGKTANAGMNNRATVTGVSNANYDLPSDNSVYALFDVVPGSNIIVWDNDTLIYNGKAQKPNAYYFTEAGDMVTLKVTIKGGGNAVEANTYTAVADKNGLELTGDTEHKFTIEKLKVTVVVNDATSVYGEPIKLNGWYVQEGSNSFLNGETPVYLDYDIKDGNAGTYEIKGACTSGNYEVTFVNGTYTIEKIEVEAPVIVSGVYTGRPQNAVVASSTIYEVLSNDNHTDAGTYSVVLRLKDYTNYKWSGAPYETLVLKFEIEKAENSWNTEFEVVNGTVEAGSGIINVIKPVPAFGSANDVTVEYFTDAECENSISEYDLTHTALSGTYYAKVYTAGNENYNEKTSVYSFKVSGQLEIKVYWEDTKLDYNGKAQAPKAYVMLDGVTKTYIEVELTDKDGATVRGGVNAGTYKATAKTVALDGTDLTSYKFALATKEAEFEILRVKLTVTIDEEASKAHLSSVYGNSTADLTKLVWNVVEGDVLSGDNLGITFNCVFGSGEFAPAGEYDVIGNAANGNYEVTFMACKYTVQKAEISVNKTGSEWFDEDGEIDKYQSHFVTLGETIKNEEGEITGYKHIKLQGGQKASVLYAMNVDKYVPAIHDNMTTEQIKQLFEGGGQTAAPEIKQGGSFVVYYCITAPNHETKYGQWRVLIEDRDKFIIVTFKNPYNVEYGSSVEGKDLTEELVNSGCIEVSGAIDDLKLLSGIAKAYAYADVDSYVNGKTKAGKYAIRFVLTDAAEAAGLGDKVFKYSATNEPNSDTNLDKYVITARELKLDWATDKFVYNGLSQIPSAKLSGCVGGEIVDLELVAGETTKVTLENGDVIDITARLIHGAGTVNSGVYSMRVTIDNANYVLENGSIVTVSIEKRPFEIVWSTNKFVYDGKSHVPTATFKDLVSGEQIAIEKIEVGKVTEVKLANGEVIKLTFALNGGNDTVNGTYGLSVSVENADYTISAGATVTVTIEREGEVSLPNWAIYAIAGAAAVALLVIIIIAVKLKRRKAASAGGFEDEDGFSDDYVG